MSTTKHFPKFSIVKGDVKVKVDLARFERQYLDAQYELDSQIMQSMMPYMPLQTRNFIQRTCAESAALAGSGVVCAGVPPMGRFLYEGKVMVDPETSSPRARKGAKKVVTDKDLTYANSKAAPHWFDTAKKNHGKAWVNTVKKIAGGG